jgi:ligand-binding SRPBCC domain-containing protein
VADVVFESRVWVPKSRPEVFEFLADPGNVTGLMPSWIGLRLLSREPHHIVAGTVLDYRIHLLGVPLALRLFIREYDPPFRFVDVQVRGPFARWEHRHLFLEGDGGTWVEDRVTYRLPLGPLGPLGHRAGRFLFTRIWRHRTGKLGEYLGPIRTTDA